MTELQAGDIVECVDAHTSWITKGKFYVLGGPVAQFSGPTWVDDIGQARSADSSATAVTNSLRLAFRPPAGEVWEPWNGGDCPVSGSVAVAFRAGGPHAGSDAETWGWSQKGYSSDIIAYRVIPAEDAVSGYEVRAGGTLDGAAGSIRTHTEAGGRKVEIGPSADTENCRRIQVDGAQWCKVYGWSSEEAQERAEAIAVALSLFDAAAPAAPIDPAKIRAGDTVLVRCKVIAVGPVSFVVETDDGEPREFDVSTGAVVGHTPKVEPLKAGDRVMALWPGELKFISGLYGWVLPDHDPEPVTFLLSDLTRIGDPS